MSTSLFFFQGEKFIEFLEPRNLLQSGNVFSLIERVVGVLPWAATINGDHFFCVHGGIGPTIARHGVRALRKCHRPATSALEVCLCILFFVVVAITF